VYKESLNILFTEGIVFVGTISTWKLLGWWELLGAGSIVALLIIFTIYFFRDPEREIPARRGIIVSPADGRIIGVEKISSPFSENRVTKITIYLSLWDVHINRIPVSGKITRVDYKSGRFYPAFEPKASEKNEHTIIEIKGKAGLFYIKQIAGMVARRIVCHLKVGDKVRLGQRFGMIKFGSRVEFYLPLSVNVKVNEGDKVRAGQTIIGVVAHD